MAAELTAPRRALLALAALLLLAAPVRAETRPTFGGSAIGSLLSEPASLDPVQARSHAEASLVGLLFDTLYRPDGKGDPVPHLASGMPVVRGRELRVPLRQGVLFHDGSTLDAADAVASLERARAGASWLMPWVASIRADGGEIVFTLRAAGQEDGWVPLLAAALAAPQTAVTPKGAPPKIRKVVGSGPWRLIAIDRKRHRVRLAAAERHFLGRPYLDELELRWFESEDEEVRSYEAGGSHLSLRGAVAFAGHQPKYPTLETEGPATLLVYVGFGRAHREVTGNRDLRAALSLAVARSSFAGLGSGERVVPALSPLPLDLGGPAVSVAEAAARPDEARAAFGRAAAAIPALRSGALALEVIVDRSRPDDRAIAEKVVAALYKLGLSAQIHDLDAASFATRAERGACDLYVGQLPASGGAPLLAYAAAAARGDDSRVEAALAKGPLDGAAAEEGFQRSLPIVPLFHRAVRVHHRESLRGVALDGLSRVDFAGLFRLGAGEPVSGSAR